MCVYYIRKFILIRLSSLSPMGRQTNTTGERSSSGPPTLLAFRGLCFTHRQTFWLRANNDHFTYKMPFWLFGRYASTVPTAQLLFSNVGHKTYDQLLDTLHVEFIIDNRITICIKGREKKVLNKFIRHLNWRLNEWSLLGS